jgi:DNA replication protein DnaC
VKVVRSRGSVRLSATRVCIKIRSALNRIYKHWATIFDKDAVLTSALLDRLLHHAETVLIEGKSYRSKDQVEV